MRKRSTPKKTPQKARPKCPVTGRVSYATEISAHNAAVTMKAVMGRVLKVYKCRHCPAYHLTSKGKGRSTKVPK